jgi:hypothetical protein
MSGPSSAAVLVLLAATAAAQPPAPEPTREKPAGPPEFEVRLADDSTVKVYPLDPSLVVATKYGRLTVPVADVRRIEVGFRYPDGIQAKVEAAAADLGSPAFRAREEGEKVLFDLKELAVPALTRAARGSDPEAVRRAEAVLKRLREKLPEERLAVRDQDLVETTEFTIHGRIETAALKVRTRFFGEAQLPVAQLRAVRAAVAETAGTLTLDAAKYARPNNNDWYDTGIEVSADRPLEVTATGQIDQWPQTPGQYMAGPGGTGSNMGGFPGPGGRMTPMPAGAVIGKIGPSGAPFLIGAAYKADRPNGTGKLFLRIVPSPWGNDSAGSYKVKVKVGS